ncbi:MFS transporter [Vibrio hibernica]|uniref:MFS transporter n=1 Tax=Vibrio hibernica TaxID=2587465 RepID=UPI0018805F9D|nr:MFS transporter [Vibrio hibernica]
MNSQLLTSSKSSLTVPVMALSLYAVASGYLMSLIPLMLEQYGLSTDAASWLASAFYAGLLLGAMFIEPIVAKIGHKSSFIVFLILFALTIAVMPLFATQEVWLFARFIAGMAVAGVFVVVESWLLIGDEKSRTKRLGLYMGALYGGTTLGQLGIGAFGSQGIIPFTIILVLLLLSTTVLVFGQSNSPSTQQHMSLSFKNISKLNKAAIIGCIVSGLLLGSIYGLMPLELQARHVTIEQIGILMALLVLGGMAVQPIVSWASNKINHNLLMGLFCVLGVFALGLTTLTDNKMILAISLVLLGMATFSLYPIAITLGCIGMNQSYIVSVTQVMLLSYSVGSVSGPMVAHSFMHNPEGLMGYLFVTLLATALYMFATSLKSKPRMVAGG